MSRRRRRRRLSEGDVRQSFKIEAMREQGFHVDAQHPDKVKFEVAESLGIPLKQGDNGDLTSEQAGKIGGSIGGSMVRKMIRFAQEKLGGQEKH